jgi:pimeloyl-ACP methyl ester carboxylesterase
MFHSPRWLAALGTTPGSQVKGFDAGHWLMFQKPALFHTAVRAWLDGGGAER